MYTVTKVESRRDLERFIKFPDRLYRDCPQYVPALHSDQRKSLTKAAPLEYCSRELFLCLDSRGHVAGRVAAIDNPRYNELYGLKRARFGWFDCIEDIEVARLLLDAASEWARGRGLNEVHGPLYYNTLGKQGMLVEGFDNRPVFNTIYNYPYYPEFMERLGWSKELDWIEYRVAVNQPLPEKISRVAGELKERYGLHEADIMKLKTDPGMVRSFFEVYNMAFASSVPNFIPFTDAEIAEEAASVMPFLDGRLSSILLDEDDSVAAFGIAFPDISEALQKARGRLFPIGWIFLLRALRRCETIDLMVNGAAPKWRGKGISAVYHSLLIDRCRAAGARIALTNPQAETNSAVRVWEKYDHSLYMRRRCWIKKI